MRFTFTDFCREFNGKTPMEITLKCIRSSQGKQRQLVGNVSYFVQCELS